MTQPVVPMTFIVHAEVSDQNIRDALGKAEYSYYFLLKAFLPALQACGRVLTVSSPQQEVDALYEQCRAAGQPCVFISFTPPNLAPTGLRCPSLCLFAWEFDTLPDGRWEQDPAQDWAWALSQQTGAIVCSQHSAAVVRRAMGDEFPVTSLAAPVWDRFATLYKHKPLLYTPQLHTSLPEGDDHDSATPGSAALDQSAAAGKPLSLTVTGYVYDSSTVEFEVDNLFPALFRRYHATPPPPPPPPPAETEQRTPAVEQSDVVLDGIIYTSVFNPVDGRKAWYDIVTAFCIAFREQEDAILLLKMTHTDPDSYRHNLNHVLHQLSPFKCRVVAFNGYLETEHFADLVRGTAFYVNASHCEGLCLPLLEFMSAGVPAIAPDHTAMADYITQDNSLVIPSSEEINIWPNDHSNRYTTRRYRNDWQALRAAFEQSRTMIRTDPDRYQRMAAQAHHDMKGFCSLQSVTAGLMRYLAPFTNHQTWTQTEEGN